MKPIIDISFWQPPLKIDYDRLAEQVSGVISATPGMAGLSNGAAYIDFYINWSGNDFSATGTKMVSGNFAWIIN